MHSATPSANLLHTPDAPQFRASLINAIQFWEHRRVFYNLPLLAVTATWLAATWPHFRPMLTWLGLGQLAVFAVLANVCYSVAYLADIPMQHVVRPGILQYCRWMLWMAGALFAILLANYCIVDEIYPFVK